MTTTRHVAQIVLVLAVVLSAIATIAGAQSTPRVVKRISSRPIEQAIQTGDTAITVIDTSDPANPVFPGPGESLLAWSCGLSNAVVVMNTVAVQATLTPSHDWITTTYTASVEQVVWPSGGIDWLPTGQQFSFAQGGGTLQIGSTLVTAKKPELRTLDVGKRYLTFLSLNSATHAVNIARRWTYWIGEDGSLHRYSAEGATATPAEDDMEGRQLNEILAAIPLVCS